jgi:uncharacterized protein
VVRSGTLRPLTRALAAVGRTALSNYLGTSLVCAFVFNGFGLGWFGRLSRVQLLAVTLAIWCLQLVVSSLWLRSFRFGPAEWLWRTLTYARLQPMRAGSGPGSAPPDPSHRLP